jgi:hypothetical protein
MSYTNSELVRLHISLSDFPGSKQNNIPVTFDGTDWIELPGGKIISGSVAVKTKKNNKPETETVVINNSPVTLNHDNLIPDSVTAASDSSLGNVFIEDIDYIIDYSNGTVKRVSDGAISDNSTVFVWYFYYSTYTENSDYEINYQNGRIRPKTGGEIAENQTLLIDYELSINRLGDDMVAEAVAEANAVIEREVDREGHFGADLTLQTAATCLAVSLLCRMAAVNDLNGGLGNTSTNAWISLAESYRKDYNAFLKSFRPPSARYNRPTHS